MKNLVVTTLVTLIGVAQANAATLLCWDKYNQSRNPALTATVVANNVLINIEEYGRTISGPVKGVLNPRALKYRGYNYFNTRPEYGGTEFLILPQNLLDQTSYFDGVSYGSNGEAGGTQHFNCIIR